MSEIHEDDVLESKTHYDTPHWEKMADIEHQMVDGISLEDRIDKEVDLVLRYAKLNLKPGDKVLDLASGTGPHAIKIAKETGADVQGRDIAEKLVDMANKKAEEERKAILDETRKQVLTVNFAEGNYSDVKASIKEGEKFKCITILGSSFIYLQSHEQYLKALHDFYDILEPGGKLVIQWREKSPMDRSNREIESEKYLYEKGYEFVELPEGKTDSSGRKALGKMCWKRGSEGGEDAFGMYITEGRYGENIHPYPDIKGPKGEIEHFSFGRVYVDCHGNEEAMETTSGYNYLEKEKLPVLKRMLKDTGFKKIKLIPNKKGIPLSQDGFRRLFAIVAQKPVK